MSEHSAKVSWLRGSDEKFIDNKYSRGHEWKFEGGLTVPASSSAHVVPTPYSVAASLDPEEAFVASLSSCHMLFFLSIAAKKRFVIDRYVDKAVGLMGKDENGKIVMQKVVLRPEVKFSGERQPRRTRQIDHQWIKHYSS